MCWSGTVRGVLTQSQGGKTLATILKNQLLLFSWVFMNNLKPIIPQWERLFTNRKDSCQVEITVKIPLGKTAVLRETAETQELHHRLCRPQLAC